MIINLNLENKKIIVIGGGSEAEKRIKSLLNEKCEIIVISDSVNETISKLLKTKQVKLKKQKIENMKFISELKPNLIITTTNDKKINQKIINFSKKKKIIAYSSDNPEDSDFSNAAIIDFEKNGSVIVLEILIYELVIYKVNPSRCKSRCKLKFLKLCLSNYLHPNHGPLLGKNETHV